MLCGASRILSKTEQPIPFFEMYIRCFMFGGPLISFYLKEISRKNEYYFYYNKGISKLSLLITTVILYILLGILAFKISHYAKLS